MASRVQVPPASWVDTTLYPHGVGGEEVLGDIEALNISNMRPDISEALRATETIKDKLVYRDAEELDTGLQKVQPLKFLDEEIDKFHQQIKDSVPLAQQANDKTPQSVLAKVDHVINLAHKGKTSLFKASELLGGTIEAYQYAREAAQDTFDIQRRSQQLLDQHDESFRQMIDCRINANIPEAERHEAQCFEHLKLALEETRADVQSHQERVTVEDEKIGADDLEEAHGTVREDIKGERGELQHIQSQCVADMTTIDSELQQLHRRMDAARKDYIKEEEKRTQQLAQNRARQQKLLEELRKLEKEETSLVNDISAGQKLQTEAAEAEKVATKKITEWKEKLDELKQKADTSLEIMQHMEKCTEWIMEDAKGQKKRWKEKLHQLEVESLLSRRDAIMASGTMHMRVINDCKRNQQEIERFLVEKEREKRTAAQTGFRSRVQDLEVSIQQFKEEKDIFEKKVRSTSEVLAELRKEVEGVDGRIRALRPGIRLDTMEERFQECKQLMETAFQKDSVKNIYFHSRFNYSA